MIIKMGNWRYWLIPGVLVLALLGVGYWGYGEYMDRQKLQNRAESQYQKSFYELAWNMDKISGQLAQLMVSSSREQGVLDLSALGRQVFAAQANLGGLPLALVPLSKSEKFLADTGAVSYALLNRTAQNNGTLTEKDYKTIEELYKCSNILREDLSKLSSQVLNQELSWTQAEVAAVRTQGNVEDNTIVNGFQLMERKMEEYPEIDLGEDFAQVRPDVRVIRGNQDINLQQAQQIAQSWWFSPGDKHQSRLAYEGGGDIPTYGLEFPPAAQEESPVYIDVSKLDGTVLWAMKPKTLGPEKIDVSQGEQNCRTFLEQHEFPEMSLVKVEQEDNTGVYTFVPQQGEVLLYPDQVKLMVALDNGDIIGYEGTPYYMFHKQRDLKTPRLTQEALRKKINPNLKVELIRPALIANSWDKEILTWEVRGAFAEEKFVIFYNADTGQEEEIVRITPPPKHQFTPAG